MGVRAASTITTSRPSISLISASVGEFFSCQPRRRVEPDDLAVEQGVLGEGPHQRREIGRSAEALGKDMQVDQTLPPLLVHAGEHRRVHDAWSDRHHPDAPQGKVARQRQGEGGDATLRARVGGLTNLALEGGDRGDVHDEAALTVLPGLIGRHMAGGVPDDIEAANQVDLDGPPEHVERKQVAAAIDRPVRGAHSGAADEQIRRPEMLRRCVDGRLHLIGVRHVDGKEGHGIAELLRPFRTLGRRQVEDCGAPAGTGHHPHHPFAEAGGASGDERDGVFDPHEASPPAGFAMPLVMNATHVSLSVAALTPAAARYHRYIQITLAKIDWLTIRAFNPGSTSPSRCACSISDSSTCSCRRKRSTISLRSGLLRWWVSWWYTAIASRFSTLYVTWRRMKSWIRSRLVSPSSAITSDISASTPSCTSVARR